MQMLNYRAVTRLSGREWTLSLAYGGAIFLGLGTLTALWQNPFFIRMTPITSVDYVILVLEALLIGLYLAVRMPGCGVKQAGLGGVLGFLGFGCSICNQILLLIFGGSFLLTYFEPIRYPVGFAGIVILAWALGRKLKLRAAMAPA